VRFFCFLPGSATSKVKKEKTESGVKRVKGFCWFPQKKRHKGCFEKKSSHPYNKNLKQSSEK
tara:strand:- start:101 stop:286 length:186 start_codon:yes stop_codon:yes gene_type:complete